MNLTDAVKSIIKPHDKDILKPLTTTWGETLNPSSVLPEYPRPQMVRTSYLNLNGYWDYAITGSQSIPENFQGKILVPFSPEASLSGVERQLKPDEYLWYRINLPLDKTCLSAGKRLLLHFGAVDYQADIYVNRTHIMTHQGGYLPFQADITPYLTNETNTLLVRVQDFTDKYSQPRGKQSLHRGGIFYTAQSGIWQSVWLEWTPPFYIESLAVTPDYDAKKVMISLSLHLNQAAAENASLAEQAPSESLSLTLSAFYEGKAFAGQSLAFPFPEAGASSRTVTARLEFTIPETAFRPWSPEDPYLYDLQLSFGEDKVESYFAMRCFTIEKHENIPVFCLNHKPYFLMGVLDQGYWPDGLYTAPSDAALVYDIETMKQLGFNMLRKHSKVEAARWYYHCDRLGMIVCQDMVNGGNAYHMPVISYLPTLCPGLSRHIKDSHYSLLSCKEEAGRAQWEKECLETIDALSFFPSIAIWTVFNEGWGQFDSERITGLIKKKDSGRLIDSASGWFDQGCGDFISIHNYFRPLSVPVKKWKERAFFLSEYGGYACHLKEHSSLERVFGYKRFESLSDLKAAYLELIEHSLLPLKKQGLSGAVLTQLSDVEEEVNGLLTYDRKVNKLGSC